VCTGGGGRGGEQTEEKSKVVAGRGGREGRALGAVVAREPPLALADADRDAARLVAQRALPRAGALARACLDGHVHGKLRRNFPSH